MLIEVIRTILGVTDYKILRYVHICTQIRTRHAALRQTRMNAKKFFI